MTPKAAIPGIWENLPVVDSARMRALDFDATARFSMPAADLMENAGRAVSAEVLSFLKEKGLEPVKARVVVCCGRGANGGDGLVAARHLRQGGAGVLVFLCPAKKDAGYPELVRGVLAFREGRRRGASGRPEQTVRGPGRL